MHILYTEKNGVKIIKWLRPPITLMLKPIIDLLFKRPLLICFKAQSCREKSRYVTVVLNNTILH